MSAIEAHCVNVSGNKDGSPLLFIHGFGCDQAMWRFIAPAFADDYKLVLFDLIGSGRSDLSRYDRRKYASLDGHASDVLAICDELALKDVTLVGHSVGSMIAVLAANRAPERVKSIILVAPSPSFIDDGDYVGGFSREDIEGMLETLDANYLGWSSQMAPVIMGANNPAELQSELTESFCRNDPDIAAHFAKVTFLSDHREDVKKLRQPSLILQCSDDAIAPMAVGNWLVENAPSSELNIVDTTGHCPHMSAPDQTATAIRNFIER